MPPLVALAVWAALATTSFGGVAMPVTANIIDVQVTSGSYSGSFTQVFPVASFSGLESWSLAAPLYLSDGSYALARLKNLQVTFNADPEVDLNFSLVNTNMVDPVNITITAATIVFDEIINPEAAAGASVTLTQGADSPSGGSITGLFEGGKIYQARYSNDPTINNKLVFASLDGPMSFVGVIGSKSESENLPESGFISLGGSCYMMESEFKFTLSPGDQASGTSAFIITPEPASFYVLAVGVAFLLRRRR